MFFLTSQKGGGITGANYLKVKNNVTHSKTIIPDRNQTYAAPKFLLLSSYIASLRCNSLQQTTAPGYKGEGKNSLRKRRDILLSDCDLDCFSLLYHLNFNLCCAILLQVVLYSV